ncbi:hypothetical protein H8D04_01580 [bacterium]|nr:hypothetical protein [bacterium]
MKNQSKIVYLLDRVIGSKGQKLKKQNEYMYWSPFISHHKPKLQINIVTGKWHCWVSSQGGHNLFQLFKKLSATKEQYGELREIVGESSYGSTVVKKTTVQTVELPKEYQPLWNGGRGPEFENAKKYMFRRGITQEDLLKYNIGYCTDGLYNNRVIIPSYDEHGQLNFFVGRDIFSSKMKYRNSPTTKDVIGFELFINWDEEITITEGVFDAFSIKRNAIPLFGKTILSKLKLKLIEKKPPIVNVCLDPDAKLDSIKIIRFLHSIDINAKHIETPEKKDAADVGFIGMLELLKKSKETKFSDIIRMKIGSI